METGETTLEGALTLYPGLRAELEPLLSLAAELSALPKVDAPASLRGYKRPVFSHGKAQPREKWWHRFLPTAVPASSWATPLVRVAAALALVVVATSGTIVASANSLPEEPLYPVKLAVENAQLAIAPNDQARSELELQFAAKRVAEVRSAAQQDNTAAVTQGVALYEQKVDAAVKASEAAAQVAPAAPEKVQETLRQNAEVLKQVQSKVQSKQAQAAIGAAIRRSIAASSSVESEPDHSAAPTTGATARPSTAAVTSPNPTIAPTAVMVVRAPTATVVMANGNGRANGRPDNAGNPNQGNSAAARDQNTGAADGADVRQRGQGAARSAETATQAGYSSVTATPTPVSADAPAAIATPVPAAQDQSVGRDRSHGGDSGVGKQSYPNVARTATGTPAPDNSRGQDNNHGDKSSRSDSGDGSNSPSQDMLHRILGNFQNMLSGR